MSLSERWYRGSPLLCLLWPVSWIFCVLVSIRRSLYRCGLLRVWQPPVPLIVAGNITVGGSGKTPLVLWLAGFLRSRGYRPGLVSRGYGGQAACWPQTVGIDADPAVVGDEAVLLARRSHCPMVVGPDRVAAVQQLLADHDVDIVIADDGMQHYRLGRTLEIAVLDGQRRLGNGWCLPAGPLREPGKRLRSVDLVVVNGEGRDGEWSMQLVPAALQSLHGGEAKPLSDWAGRQVHAVAGIGHPQRFFAGLREAGLILHEHVFPDHYPYRDGELDFSDGLPVLMTEKDAVKYRPYARENHWYLPVDAHLSEEFARQLMLLLENKDG